MAETKELSMEEMQAIIDKQAAQLAAIASTGGKPDLIVPGTFTVEGEAPNGKKVKETYQFAPGAIRCRLENGHEVSSAALLKLANGEVLEETEANHDLVSLGAEGAKNWLTYLITQKQATFLVKVAAALLFVLFAFSSGLSAQIKNGYVQNFPGESMTNADTIYFTVSKSITDNEAIEGIWQFAYVSTSGTANVIVQIQERSIAGNDNAWSIVKTDTIKAAKKTVFYKHDVYGTEQRVFVRTTGTQVTLPVAQVRYRRKYQYP